MADNAELKCLYFFVNLENRCFISCWVTLKGIIEQQAEVVILKRIKYNCLASAAAHLSAEYHPGGSN